MPKAEKIVLPNSFHKRKSSALTYDAKIPEKTVREFLRWSDMHKPWFVQSMVNHLNWNLTSGQSLMMSLC